MWSHCNETTTDIRFHVFIVQVRLGGLLLQSKIWISFIKVCNIHSQNFLKYWMTDLVPSEKIWWFKASTASHWSTSLAWNESALNSPLPQSCHIGGRSLITYNVCIIQSFLYRIQPSSFFLFFFANTPLTMKVIIAFHRVRVYTHCLWN